MLDIRLFRENPEVIRENLKKKFQEHKLETVDQIIDLDVQYRKLKTEADSLRGLRNSKSKEIGKLMGQKKFDEAEQVKKEVQEYATKLQELEEQEGPTELKLRELLMTIPNIIDPSVPIGRDDSENVELYRVGKSEKKDHEVSDRKSVV